MAKPEAVSNSGPLIHLAEIGGLEALAAFSRVFVPPEVLDEVGSNFRNSTSIEPASNLHTLPLVAEAKDYARILMEKYEVDLGEAAAMALSKQQGAGLFLTDDLAARATAKELGLEPHGTVGIILRAYRTGVIDKKTSKERVRDIRSKSSLFITDDLITFVLREMERKP